MEAHLRWAGHTERMGETRIPRMLLFGELEQGTRHVSRPLKRYKDQLKATLKGARFSQTTSKAWLRTERIGVHFEGTGGGG